MPAGVPEGSRVGGCPISVLFVEDNQADVELCVRALRMAWFEVSGDVVDTREELTERLRTGSYDLVVADYRLHGWTGLDALEVVRAQSKETPVILVTGALGEEAAVECVKRGITDFVLKDHLTRLPIAVRRALEERSLREVQRRAQQATARLAAVVESSDDAIFGASLEGVISDWNAGAERMYGYSAQEAIGRPLSAIFPPEQVAEVPRLIEAVRRGDSVRNFETARRVRSGASACIALTLSPIRGGDGALAGISGIARDLTERKRLEQRLRHQNDELIAQNRRVQEACRLKDEFLASMSHELRSPLNGIIGFSELLHDGKLGPVSEEHREILSDVLASGRHLLGLINDLLDLAKVEAGKMQFRPEAAQLSRLVQEVADVLWPVAEQKRIAVSTQVASEVDSVIVDPARFKQVLYNYLSNALKFTPADGRVAVRVLQDSEGEFRLEVEDNGIGIAAGQLGHLFRTFSQLGATASDQGSGLGLALTKRIVEAQGGRVGLQSTPGSGSVFFAVLPRSPRPQATQAEAPLVLVVEDEPGQRAWTKRLLTWAGYTVETVGDGAEAIARCRARRYHAITLDLLLPDTSGWDVLREIRSTALNAGVPVIVVSMVSERGAGSVFPIQGFLTKPVVAQELLDALVQAGVPPGESKFALLAAEPALVRKARRQLAARQYRPAPECQRSPAGVVGNGPGSVLLELLAPGMDSLEFLLALRRMPDGRRSPVMVWTASNLSDAERVRLREWASAFLRACGESEPPSSAAAAAAGAAQSS